MAAYYNEIDPYCVQWLKSLIAKGLISAGDVDDRPIQEVQPEDLRGYDRCHFFAGIAGWDYALQLAGSPDDRPVWTGSCPCQPFSSAGQGKATHDERHLWPEWFRLIRSCKPPTIFGEQVEAAIGWGWLDLVQSDLEAEGYAIGAAVLPACGVGAPHIRQRLWFMANAEGCDGEISISGRGQEQAVSQSRGSSGVGELADAAWAGHRCVNERWMGDTNTARSQGRSDNTRERPGQCSPWSPSSLVWLPCTDGKQRPTKPGIFPLAHGVPGTLAVVCANCGAKTKIDEELRVVRLRACRQGQEQTQILRPEMHGPGAAREASNTGVGEVASQEDFHRYVLRELWRDIQIASASCGWRPDEQQPAEREGSLCEMPCTRAQEAVDPLDLRGVWQGVHRQRPSQASEDLLCQVCGGVGPHQCTKEMGSRVKQLRAIGNAIVPQVAAEFIKATM